VYLVGLPHHGSPLSFPTCPQLPPEIHRHQLEQGWPTSFGWRERPAVDEFGCRGA